MAHTKSILRPLIVALGFAVAVPIGAQAHSSNAGDGPHGKGFHHKQSFAGHGGRHGGDFTRRLNLTDAQRDKVFELRHAAAPALRSKGNEVRATRKEMRQLAMADSFDESRVTALSNQLARTEAEYTVMRLRLNNQVYNVLTPEQRKQAVEMRKHRFERAKAAGSVKRTTPRVQ